MTKNQKTHADILIIGAGIVGISTAFHLAEMGHSDVLVIDRDTLEKPLGSTGHAPGFLGRNSTSASMAQMAEYTAELFSTVPNGNPSMHRLGSIEVTRDRDNGDLFEDKLRVAHTNGFDARLLTQNELTQIYPFMDSTQVAHALLVEGDGVVDARLALRALYERAKSRGVRFLENTLVSKLQTSGGRITGVATENGRISCSRLVVAAGIWGGPLLKSLDLALPIYSVQHPFVYTMPMKQLDDVVGVAKRPMIRDLDNTFYMREFGKQFGFGWYNHQPLTIDASQISRADIPFPDRGFLDKINFDLFPFLKEAKLSSKLNGIFSMTPDGAPLLGEITSIPGLWLAEAVWVTHSGGVGKALAERLLGKSPSFEIEKYDPERFASLPEKDRLKSALDRYTNIFEWSMERLPR